MTSSKYNSKDAERAVFSPVQIVEDSQGELPFVFAGRRLQVKHRQGDSPTPAYPALLDALRENSVYRQIGSKINDAIRTGDEATLNRLLAQGRQDNDLAHQIEQVEHVANHKSELVFQLPESHFTDESTPEDIAAYLETALTPIYDLINASLDRSTPNGFNKHDTEHINFVARAVDQQLIRQDATRGERIAGQLAAWFHDVGNLFSRAFHPHVSNLWFREVSDQILQQLFADPREREHVRRMTRRAIVLHDEVPAIPVRARSLEEANHLGEVLSGIEPKQRPDDSNESDETSSEPPPPDEQDQVNELSLQRLTELVDQAFEDVKTATPEEIIKKVHADIDALLPRHLKHHLPLILGVLHQLFPGEETSTYPDKVQWQKKIQQSFLPELRLAMLNKRFGRVAAALIAGDKSHISWQRTSEKVTEISIQNDEHYILNALADSEDFKFEPDHINWKINFRPSHSIDDNPTPLHAAQKIEGEMRRERVPDHWQTMLEENGVPYLDQWFASCLEVYEDRLILQLEMLATQFPKCDFFTIEIDDSSVGNRYGRTLKLTIPRHQIKESFDRLQQIWKLPNGDKAKSAATISNDLEFMLKGMSGLALMAERFYQDTTNDGMSFGDLVEIETADGLVISNTFHLSGADDIDPFLRRFGIRDATAPAATDADARSDS